jgi:hypothetical protein
MFCHLWVFILANTYAGPGHVPCSDFSLAQSAGKFPKLSQKEKNMHHTAYAVTRKQYGSIFTSTFCKTAKEHPEQDAVAPNQSTTA